MPKNPLAPSLPQAKPVPRKMPSSTASRRRPRTASCSPEKAPTSSSSSSATTSSITPSTPAELATVTNIAALEYRFLRILGFEGAQLAAHAEALHPTLAADYSSIHSQRLFALTQEATSKTSRNANPAIIRYMISAVNMTRNMAHFFEKMRKLKGDPSQPCLEPDYDNLPHIAHPPLHIDQSVLPVPDIEHCSTAPQPDPEPEPGPEPEPTPTPQEPPTDPAPKPIIDPLPEPAPPQEPPTDPTPEPIIDPQPDPPPKPQTATQNPPATTETWIDTGICDTHGNPIHLPQSAVKPGFTPPQSQGFRYNNEATKPLIDSQPATYKQKPPSGWW